MGEGVTTMRLDRARFVIRPRGMLESLDLAFLFCGQHWWGLLLAAACGIVPAMAFNWWLASSLESPQFLLFVLMVMEAPWITVGMTLYLGQITFAERYSSRLAWKMFWRGWPQLLVFQTIVRNMALCTWILGPVAYVSLYYMNQVILLEQTQMSHTWARRTALNTRNLASIIRHVVLELMIFTLGVFVLSQMLKALSALWRDRYSWLEQMLSLSENPWGWLGLEQWETQLACWLSLSFITVWRYATYLDCRVRREGWDVELRMRAQALVYQTWEAQ